MTYSEFINSLISPIHTFFDCFGYLISVFINNYIFVTLLGLTLFVFFFHFIKNIIIGFINSDYDLDNIADKKRGK